MKSNVCYNLSKSNFYTTYKHYTFYFSSEFNKTRFETQINSYAENEILKLNARYGTMINAHVMVALQLYKKIEKRGFYVKTDNGLLVSKAYEIMVRLV